MIVCFSILVSRLYNLTTAEAHSSLSVLDGQYTGKITPCSRSGFIYDRNGQIISHNISGRLALVNPAECNDALYYADRISRCALVSSPSDIYEKILCGTPFTVALKQNQTPSLVGVYCFDTYEEDFCLAPHLLGYKNIDGNGVTGLRLSYNDYLYGKERAVSAAFDTNAKRQSLSPFKLTYAGYTSADGIVTTLDKTLQAFCDSLEEEVVSGAVLVSKTDTGEILAMSSFPSYDVNNLSASLSSDKGELINRCLRSFTPGSVFKIVTSVAALEYDKALFDYQYTCTGEAEIDGNIFRCHKKDGHGAISMEEAFAQSCNTYFISLGEKIGLCAIADIMKKLELDTSTSCSFMREADNRFLSENSDDKKYLANISFGQGDLCLSPLDMARIVNAAASGYLTELLCVSGELCDDELKLANFRERQRIISENTAEKLLEMMEKCVCEGTGRSVYAENKLYGGKTATAQTGTFDENGVEKVNKWFCGVDDVKNPSISVIVLCDFTTNNERSPAVVCRKILDFYK